MTPTDRPDEKVMQTALDDMKGMLGPGGWEACVADLIRSAPGVLAALAAARDELAAVRRALHRAAAELTEWEHLNPAPVAAPFGVQPSREGP